MIFELLITQGGDDVKQKKKEQQSSTGVRTYPLQFPSEKLEEIKNKADSKGLTIKAFIHNAIEVALKK